MATTKELQISYTYATGKKGTKSFTDIPREMLEKEGADKKFVTDYSLIVDGSATAGVLKVCTPIDID